MSTPTSRDVHIETALSNISVAYHNASYIADQVFPVVPVQKKTDYYWVFPKEAFLRNQVGVRAPGTRAPRADYTLTTASYACVPWAIAKLVPDEVRKNSDNPLQPDVLATEFVTDQLLKAQELRVAAIVTNSGGWAYSASPTTQWSASTSDPIGDIETAINGIVSTIGAMPNVAVMSWDVWRRLRNHPDLADRIKYTRNGATLEAVDLAEWFGFQKVLIGSAIYDTSQEGATPSRSYIWGDDFWCGYVPAVPSLMTPAAGYTLEWEARTIRRYRQDQEHTDVIEGTHSTDEVVSASDAGAIIYNAV